MTSNIGARDAGAADRRPRDRLVAEVVGELTSWNPREWTRALRHWHRGAISLVHLDVLLLLEDAGPMSMGSLAELLDVSVASATGIISRMENRGLVVRRHDETDRRVVVVDRSPVGEQIFRDIDARRREGLTRLLDSLTDDELSALLTGHRALHAARAAYVAEAVKAAEGAQPNDVEQAGTVSAHAHTGSQQARGARQGDTVIGLLRTYLRPYARQIALIIGLLLVQAIGNLYLPTLNGDIINDGVAKGDTDYIIRTGGLMLVVTLVVGVASIIAVYFAARTAMGLRS